MAAVRQPDVQRTTQGFVSNLSFLGQRPALTLLEVAWRWCFGIPALWLTYRAANQALAIVPHRGTQNLSLDVLLTNPPNADWLLTFAYLIGAHMYRVCVWLVPVLLLTWAAVSGVGRTVVLRRMDGTLHAKPATLIMLQLVRLLSLAVIIAAWLLGLYVVAAWSILQPIASSAQPNIMPCVGGAIVLTFAAFVLSAAVGWIFSIAPLLAMIHNTGPWKSLRDALHIGSLRSGLIEINLVLGIVKIALLVLAIVFSACPLPFQSVMTDQFLLWWNVGVAIWYFLASDFFHVARLSSYLRLWQGSLQQTTAA